jgi:hypothetical protein
VVSAGTAQSVPAVTVPDMVVALEQAQAKREGAMSPGVAPAVRDFGLGILSDALPADFIAGLSGVTRRGVPVYPVTLQTDDADGAALFRNADGEPFYVVGGGSPDWDPAWIADLHGTASFHGFDDCLAAMFAARIARGIPTNGVYEAAFMATAQTYRPSHLVHAYTLIDETDLDAYLAAPQPMAFMASTALSPPPLTGLAFTAFSADSGGVTIALEWPPNTVLAGNALDLFHTRTLAPPQWTNVFRYPLPVGATGFSNSILYDELPSDCVGTLTVVTNANGGGTHVVELPYSGALYTNVIPSVVTNWPIHSAFFTAADLNDTDGDGLTDATERLVTKTKINSSDSDSDGCGDFEEWKMGTNPNFHDSMADSDGDDVLDFLDSAPLNPSVPVQSAFAFAVVHPAQGATLP